MLNSLNIALFTSPCRSGYYAPYSSLCKPCPKYTYKDFPGYESCSPCLNKPTNSYYTNAVGLESVNCPYTCQTKFSELNTSSCETFLQKYYETAEGIYLPTMIVITIFVIVVGRIMKSYLKKTISIKEYDYCELEKVLNSPEKIQA